MTATTANTKSPVNGRPKEVAPKEVFAGIICYMLAPFGMGLLPLLGGAAVDRFALSATEVGFLGTSDLAGIAVSCVLSVFWVGKVSLRKAAWVSVMILLFGNVLSMAANSFTSLCAARFIAELGSGGMFSLALVTLGNSSHPERFLSLGIAATLVSAAPVYLFLPEFITSMGIEVVFAAHLAVIVFALAWVHWLPVAPLSRTVQASEGQANYLPLAFCFLALFCLTVIQGGVWTYLERIGNAAGLSPDFIGNALALTQFTSLAGALATSVLGTKFGRMLPLTLGVVALVISFYLFQLDAGSAYVTAACTTQFCYVFCLPYLMSLCVENDPSGKFYVLTNVFKLVGMAVGPAIIALFISGENYFVVSVVGSIFAILCLIFSALVLTSMRSDRRLKKMAA